MSPRKITVGYDTIAAAHLFQTVSQAFFDPPAMPRLMLFQIIQFAGKYYGERRRTLAFTFFRYFLTTLSGDAPSIKRPLSIPAAITFSLTIRLASLFAFFPPAASLIVLNQITR